MTVHVATSQATPTGPSPMGRSSQPTQEAVASTSSSAESSGSLGITAKDRAYAELQELLCRCALAQAPVVTEAGEHAGFVVGQVISLGEEVKVIVNGRTTRTAWRALAAAIASDDQEIPKSGP